MGILERAMVAVGTSKIKKGKKTRYSAICPRCGRETRRVGVDNYRCDNCSENLTRMTGEGWDSLTPTFTSDMLTWVRKGKERR